MNDPIGFEDGGLCMVQEPIFQEVSDRYRKQICASRVYAPMTPGGSGSQMSGESIFQKKMGD